MRIGEQLLFFAFCLSVIFGRPIDASEKSYIPFRVSDPASYVKGVSIIDGSFTATETDLVVVGPDPLVLSRFYSSKDEVGETNFGGWRIFPQCLLVMGSCSDGKVYAFAGERSGAILTYSGNGKGSLKIDMFIDGVGMVNTYAGEINGQLNHRNNRLNCREKTCELILGDGTKRTYRQVQGMPDVAFCGKIPSNLLGDTSNHKYFELISEKLPSGNILLFSYESGRLSLVEMRDSSQKKLHAFIRFDYGVDGDKGIVRATTSDERILEYHFEKVQLLNRSLFALQKVSGSHCFPISYEYELIHGAYVLNKRVLPGGRYLGIEYDEKGGVKHLKEPPTTPDEPEIVYRFIYGNGRTEVFNAKGLKTRYLFDEQQQLNAIEQYDIGSKLYRIDRKYWGESEQDYGMLKALSIANGQGRVYSLRALEYDAQGNVKKDTLYGNLTGQKEAFLDLDEKGRLLNDNQVERHIKTHKYSIDGFNLLSAIEDCKGNQILFEYKSGSNLLIKKLIKSEGGSILKRLFYYYNMDAVCKSIIEDDGSSTDSAVLDDVTERHITLISPKESVPGVGLPEEVKENALDIQTGNVVLVSKRINSFFPQGQICSTQVYDDTNHFAYTSSKTYTNLGLVESETDPEGRKTFYKYDEVGNQIQVSIPFQKRIIQRKYDLRNRCYENAESAEGFQAIELYEFDHLGRKLSSTDRFSQITRFDYDEFGRIKRMIHPPVCDEQGQLVQPNFSYTYDIFGNILSTTDPKGYVTSTIYNLRGSPTQIFYPDGTTEFFKYDLEGSLHRSLTRDNLVTVHEYDYLGRVSYQETSKISNEANVIFLKGHSYKYNGFRPLQEVEIEGIDEFRRVTRFKHDPAGKIISTIQYDGNLSENDPSSRKTEFFYDGLGREIKKKIWFGGGSDEYSFECCEYDLLGQIRSRRAEDSTGRILLQRYFDYDIFGRCNEEYAFHNGLKQTLLKTKYDPFGELLSYSNSLENETLIVVGYEGSSFHRTVIGSLGYQTEISFDALGRKTSTIKKDAQGALLSSQNIFYDVSGNKSLEINSNIWKGRTEGVQKTRWIYGPMNRLEVQIDAEGTPEEKKTEFTYDQFGRLSTKILPGALTPLTYSYNERGLLEKIEYKAKEKDQQILNRYSYDASGNIISAKSLNKVIVERYYDAFGQMVREEIESGSYDPHFSSVHYQYDRRGRLKKISLPDKSTISYVYGGLFGQRIDRLSSKGSLLYQHKYNSYDDQGRAFEEIGIAGHRTLKYDKLGRKIEQRSDYFSEIVPENGYDPLGNLLEVKRHGTFIFQSGTYTYDSLSQLASEETEDFKTYSCDSLSNFRLVNEEPFISNNCNQLSHFAKREYFYDPQGNLLRKIMDKTETRFTSDILSRLIAVEKDNGTILQCNYDAFGRRITKELSYIKGNKNIPLSFSQTFYIGNHELGSLDEKTKICELRVPGLSSEGISQTSVAIEIGSQIYAPLHDLSGNVIAMVDFTTKEVAESYSYSAFAEEKIYDSNGNRIFCSAIGNPWRYKEKRMDEETGLIYFGFRYYDSETRRWTSPDPLGSVDGPNLYSFLRNNPLTSFDKFGLAAEDFSNEPLHQYFYSEVENHCYCERHRTCKRGGDIGSFTASNLPLIKYDFVFEKIWEEINPWQNQSQIFDLQKKEIPNFEVGFINGVWNSREDARENAEYISQLAGGYNVRYVYNASHGSLIDLLECYMGLRHIATEPVRQLHKMWDRFFEKSSPDARYLMIGHSQGVIHLRNALLSYPSERRNRILATAIAPAAYIYEETVAHVRHYRAKSRWGDIIPWVDRIGSHRSPSSIIDLPSNSFIPLGAHPFMKKIYSNYLRNEIENYLPDLVER